MSTVSENPTDPQTSEPWREKFKRQYMELKGLAWEGMMLDKIMQQNKMARDLARRTADGTLGSPTEGTAEDEDMGVRIGDEIHYHTSNPAVPADTATTSSGGALTTAALVAGLLAAGGVPAAIGTYYLTRPATSIEQPATPAPTVEADTTPAVDHDTRYGLSVSSSPGPPAEIAASTDD